MTIAGERSTTIFSKEHLKNHYQFSTAKELEEIQDIFPNIIDPVLRFFDDDEITPLSIITESDGSKALILEPNIDRFSASTLIVSKHGCFILSATTGYAEPDSIHKVQYDLAKQVLEVGIKNYLIEVENKNGVLLLAVHSSHNYSNHHGIMVHETTAIHEVRKVLDIYFPEPD